jgi:hypothetical protein
MSETQIKITGSFEAVDDKGNQYHIVEHTLFRKTTTIDMALGGGEGEEIKEYKLANGKVLKQISKTEFEVESDGTKIRKLETQ